jgi:hypothetical protein
MKRVLCKGIKIILFIWGAVLLSEGGYAQSSVFNLSGSIIKKNALGAAVEKSRFLEVFWTGINGADEYDLEWTTTDDPITSSSAALFLNNSSRVTIAKSLSYLIPLLSTNTRIAVRIRQVQYNTEDVREEGAWEYTMGNGNFAIWQIDWNEEGINWQASTTYAEEGKRKDVVSYFDGSLRNRQTVTVSDTVAVVQENIYDEFGRVVANILPVPFKEKPVETPFLHYFSNFNLNSQNLPYSFKDLQDLCEIKPGLLKGGAATYYSPQNQFLADPLFVDNSDLTKNNLTKYIPDASGFPVSVIQYTPDNTGRTKLQGGVGPKFQPGTSGNRLTKYFYSVPAQLELDKLFGSDAGLAKYYTKNMVIDPNQQVSISYTNSSGKVVATALAGGAPENQDALPSNAATQRKVVTLITPDQFVYDATSLKLTATTKHVVTVDGNADVIYNISRLTACAEENAFSLCKECTYDFKLKVTNSCGEIFMDHSIPVTLNSPANNDISMAISKILTVGEYNIQMELALSEKKAEDFAEAFVKEGQVAGKFDTKFHFVKKYLYAMDISAFGGCERCKETLGEREVFKEVFVQKVKDLITTDQRPGDDALLTLAGERYDQLMVQCNALISAGCNNISPCNKYVELLSADVSPGGQYALLDADNNLLEPEHNVLSDALWRNAFPVKAPSDPLYQATLIEIPASDTEENTATIKISPYDADFSVSMRVKYWQEEWALYLISQHPEYCKFQFCQQYEGLFKWDEHVKEDLYEVSSTSVLSASAGTFNNSQFDWLLERDPFFQTTANTTIPGAPVTGRGIGNLYYESMKNDLEYFSSNVLFSWAYPEKSITQFVDFLIYNQNTASANDPDVDIWYDFIPPEQSDPCRLKDREWNFYKEFYFLVKERYVKKYRNEVYCASRLGDCKVGIPTTFPVPGDVQAADFMITKVNAPACTETEQTIKVTYMGGKLPKACIIDIYYPGLTVPRSVAIESGASIVTMCIPAGVALKNVKVSDVILN